MQQALEVARRWLPAFLEGRRADEELYADEVTTWHNIGPPQPGLPYGSRSAWW
ncbi:MAG: hypothetical protein ACI379_04995 [Nocardioides sp.]|uniref:hypothetical protein n=1 Tax=Nocardioides sp. TaxID=35761 RepID=UPI003F08C73D